MVIMIYLMIRMTSRKNGKVNLRSHHEALETDLKKKINPKKVEGIFSKSILRFLKILQFFK